MVNMTDPIVNRTGRQLDGYGLNNYDGRATPATRSQTVSLSLLEICEDKLTVRSMTIHRRLIIVSY
jgi:hypothetical protein